MLNVIAIYQRKREQQDLMQMINGFMASTISYMRQHENEFPIAERQIQETWQEVHAEYKNNQAKN